MWAHSLGGSVCCDRMLKHLFIYTVSASSAQGEMDAGAQLLGFSCNQISCLHWDESSQLS